MAPALHFPVSRLSSLFLVDDGAANTWVYVDANKDGNFQADTDLAIQFVGLTGATVPVLADFIFA